MPKIYLSPSTQQANEYAGGTGNEAANNEEYYMNKIADALETYLIANNIEYKRNSPDMSVVEIVEDSNSENYDLHIAIHSNASPTGFSGELQGPNIFYYPGSEKGFEAAQLVAYYLSEIYPMPELTAVIENSILAELRRTKVPSVYIETAYHDNPSDAAWIRSSTEQIARAIAQAIVEYFGGEFNEPSVLEFGTVQVQGDDLNVRSSPSLRASVIGTVQNGQKLVILRRLPGWYLISSNGINGYVSSNYIEIKEPLI